MSIMSHYKELGGPDMLEVAELVGKMGNAKGTVAFSKAVIGDFEECEAEE